MATSKLWTPPRREAKNPTLAAVYYWNKSLAEQIDLKPPQEVLDDVRRILELPIENRHNYQKMRDWLEEYVEGLPDDRQVARPRRRKAA